MKSSVPTNVDYRRSETCADQESCDSAPSLPVDGLHTVCWDRIRVETHARGLVVEYVVSDVRPVLLASVDAWKCVTCGVCGDTWRLSGYGLNTGEVVAVRQAILRSLATRL